jgi:hypothetical protein
VIYRFAKKGAPVPCTHLRFDLIRCAAPETLREFVGLFKDEKGANVAIEVRTLAPGEGRMAGQETLGMYMLKRSITGNVIIREF